MFPLQEVGVSVDTVSAIAKLIEEQGALVVFAIASGLTNAFLIYQIITGKLVPYKMYKSAVDELARLRKTMENENKQIWAKVLMFMGGLKATKEVSEDASTDRSAS